MQEVRGSIPRSSTNFKTPRSFAGISRLRLRVV